MTSQSQPHLPVINTGSVIESPAELMYLTLYCKQLANPEILPSDKQCCLSYSTGWLQWESLTGTGAATLWTGWPLLALPVSIVGSESVPYEPEPFGTSVMLPLSRHCTYPAEEISVLVMACAAVLAVPALCTRDVGVGVGMVV